MLAKKYRFSFKGSLPKQVLNSRVFSVRYGKNDGELKAAVVVSKRVDKRATVRNKIKRRILDAVRKNLDLKTSLNIVFYVKKSAQAAKDLEREIEQTLTTIKNF